MIYCCHCYRTYTTPYHVIPSHSTINCCYTLRHSLHLVTKAEFAAQIFRYALVRSQETDIKQFLVVAKLCIAEQKVTALSVLLKVPSLSILFWSFPYS